MPSAVAAQDIGAGPCWGETCGDKLEAMARIAPSQLNEAMARIASRRNRTKSLDPDLSAFNFRVGFEFPCRGGLGEKRGKIPPPVTTTTTQADRAI